MNSIRTTMFQLTAAGLFLALLTMMCVGSAHAQSPNLALQSNGCVCTHSSGGSGTYGPDQYNDGLFTAWGWTGTSGNPDPTNYIQFTWTSPKSVGEITFFRVGLTTRCLSAGRIQYWNGTSWINHWDFTLGTTSLTESVTFPSVATTMLRVTYMTITGSQTSNPNFYEIEIRSTVNGFNNAGINDMTSPNNFCAGSYPVTVNLTNAGFNQITSATINWKLNNVLQTPISWTGLLDTLNVTTRNTQVTLTTMNFASGTPYTFEVWSSMPNGVADTVTNNDTLIVTKQAALSGSFTIGGASPDFPNIAAAVNALNQFGLCGPVVFDIRSGTYNEQVSLGSIAGSSAVNTVTFQSETGNRADVNLTSGAATSTTNNYVFQLNGADYVTVRNMTITATNGSYGTVLDIQGGAEHNTFENVDFMGVQTTSTSSYMTVIWSPSGSLDNYNTLLGCNIRNGSFNMYMYGSGTTATENGFHVENCEFTGAYYYPIYFYYMGELEFLNNRVVKDSGYPYMYSMLMYYGFNSKIERNTFTTDGGTYGYGFMIYYDNYYQTGTSRIVNNFFTSRNSNPYAYYAARVYYCNDILFAHNTLYMDGTYASGYTLYSYYGANQRYFNNIIINTGVGRAWYVPSPAAISASDYNNIVAAGSVLAYWSGDRANLLALQTASCMDAASVS
ncbi:MAG: hypothetical protein IH600_03885, partial [Bacteroidetes bacterium]|nr:hypothetical protein [Bacteroidota bacterium]